MVVGIVCDSNVQEYEKFFRHHTDIKISKTIKEVLLCDNRQQLVLLYINYFEDIALSNLSGDNLSKIEHQYIKLINDAYKKDKTVTIVLFQNNFLLTQFQQTKKHEITPLKFIRYAKHHLMVQKRITDIANKTAVPLLVLTDFLYDFKLQNLLKFKIFTKINFSYNNRYQPPLLRHQNIPNWEIFFNQLSVTDYNKYLK